MMWFFSKIEMFREIWRWKIKQSWLWDEIFRIKSSEQFSWTEQVTNFLELSNICVNTSQLSINNFPDYFDWLFPSQSLNKNQFSLNFSSTSLAAKLFRAKQIFFFVPNDLDNFFSFFLSHSFSLSHSLNYYWPKFELMLMTVFSLLAIFSFCRCLSRKLEDAQWMSEAANSG